MSTDVVEKTDLSFSLGPNIESTEVGLRFTGKETFEEWEHAGAVLKTITKRTPWAWGDWLVQGEQKTEWGERYDQVINDTGLEYSTVTKLKSLSKRCEHCQRWQTLDWGHHLAVYEYADLTDRERQKLLDTADKDRDSTGRAMSVAKLRNLAKQTVEKKRLEKPKPKQTAADWTLTGEQEVVECNALISDPPYGILDEAWEPDQLEQFTRDWASRWNECGADFIALFWSQDHLWNGRRWFDECLGGYQFQQLLVWVYRNNKSPQSRLGYKQTWEPVFFYRRTGCDRLITIDGDQWGDDCHDMDTHIAGVPQSNFNEQDMKHHPAQKPVSVMLWLVGSLTKPGELVCDPFTGSGTTGIAALQLGRRFHGIEINEEYRRLAEGRIATYGKAF